MNYKYPFIVPTWNTNGWKLALSVVIPDKVYEDKYPHYTFNVPGLIHTRVYVYAPYLPLYTSKPVKPSGP